MEPLTLAHAEELLETVDADTFALFVGHMPTSLGLDDFKAFLQRTLDDPTFVSFVARDKGSDRVVGKSSYLDIRPAHRGLEIGATWVSKRARGTYVNPEMKHAMMKHAFEELDYVRVQLKTDMRNELSRAAILKAGAKFEGVLRRHCIQPNGYIRDTAMYSVTVDEWPEVKAMLEERIAAL